MGKVAIPTLTDNGIITLQYKSITVIIGYRYTPTEHNITNTVDLFKC